MDPGLMVHLEYDLYFYATGRLLLLRDEPIRKSTDHKQYKT